MQKRKITVYNTSANVKVELTSEAATWGELQVELDRNGVEYVNKRAMVDPTRVSLESSEAVLPEFDFYLHLSPLQNKFGGQVEDYKEMGFSDLRSFAAGKVSCGSNPTRAALEEALDEYFANQQTVSESASSNTAADIMEHISNIESSITKIRDLVSMYRGGGITTEELAQRWALIKATL